MPTDRRTIEPLLIGVREACSVLGLSRSVFYSLLASQKIGPVPIRLGDTNRSKPLFDLAELRQWIAAKNENGSLPGREQWAAMRGAR